jgi:predicted MFS family arabinose efflux permease
VAAGEGVSGAGSPRMRRAGPGSLLAGRALRRLGLGQPLIAALSVFGLSGLVLPLAPRQTLPAIGLVAASQFLMALSFQVSAINFVAMRQMVSPPDLLGRVNATFRFVGLGLSPLGALAGGLIGAGSGARAALAVAALGLLIAPPLLLLSRVRRFRSAG